MTLTFTAEQNELLNGLGAWKQSSEPTLKAANLSAYAGCGKTTVLSHFVKELQNSDERVLVIAPTHAALSQLKLRLCPVVNTHVTFKTVSAALGQVPFQSNTSTELTFFTSGNYNLDQFALVVVDESSMLSESEVKALIKNCQKVIFLGDAGQLAPVKKKSAASLLTAIPTQFSLTKVLRSNDVIAQEAIKARTIPQYIPQSSDCGSVVCHENEEALLEAFFQRIASKEMSPGSVVWISHTNKEVNEVNSKAHYLLTGNLYYLVPGDYIRLGQNCALGKNNTIVQLTSTSLTPQGCFTVTTAPQEDGSEVRVDVALPDIYEQIEKSIATLVELFKKDQGSKALELELKTLRAIVPVDFTYSVTVYKSQGASIPEAYVNSQRLVGQKAFYVGYSRAAQQLNCCKKVLKTKGFSAYSPEDLSQESLSWVNKLTGAAITLPTAEALNPHAIRVAIMDQCADIDGLPSVSHLQCVLNPSHASKSAKGWVLAP